MCMQLTFLNFNMLIFFLICNINLNATNVIQCDRNVGKLIIIILVFAKQFVVNKGVFFVLTDYRMEHIFRVSEVLYVGLCCRLGTPTIVNLRREVMDMELMIQTTAMKRHGTMFTISGSYREGFRFKSSDQDTMVWNPSHKLIYEMSQFKDFDASGLDVILMEHSGTPPGFVRLKLLTPFHNILLISSAVTHGHCCYLSSEKFRTQGFYLFRIMIREGMQTHGPCTNFYIDGTEHDFAWCFACQYWPQTALAWVARCQEKGWPVQSVVNEITSSGCHVIPIESNVSCDEYALEWRLSFSQAEQILVYSMNHTQFLCYGVLKIFLKEVLSSTNQGSLICSYFLKTILFWEIQNDPDSLFWRPSNLLTCFWVCFKRLCKCVLDSNCPNFFIPENNMFRLKIVGSQQEALISQLNRYYEMGVACLFLSPTFMTILEPALSSPSFVIPSSEGDVMSLRGLDQNIRNELFKRQKVPQSKEDCFMILKSIPSLVQLRLSQFQSLALQHATANILVQLAFILADYPASHQNKTFYIQDRRIVNVLRLSSRFGPVSQLLYLGYITTEQVDITKFSALLEFVRRDFHNPLSCTLII